MRLRSVFATQATLLLSIVSLCGSGTPADDGADRLPTVAELEKVKFTEMNPGTVESPPYAEVSAVRGFFVAYGVGSDAISKYREPVLTRGTQGVTVFKTVSPAVVVVVVGNIKNGDFDPEGMGTGAIVDPRGYVLTNWHVIKEHRGAIVFLKPTNSSELADAQARIARVIYQDPTVDLALLQITEPPSALHWIPVGDITQVQIAEDIHIIGHPHGNLWSYSTGVVSQIRDRYSWSYEDGSRHLAKVLQLQTAINPGNSGGPVVDDAGNILGLVAMSEEGQNLDYAIAADVIKRFLFTGMQMNTRGVDLHTAPSASPRQLLSGKLGESLVISKAVYSDAVLYGILESGKSAGLVATFADGMAVRAWNPDQNGQFRYWSARLRNGNELVATTSGGTLTSIGTKPQRPSLSSQDERRPEEWIIVALRYQ
jgi:S1-C subfamily serine protease